MGSTACTEPQCLYKGALYLYLTFISTTPLRTSGSGGTQPVIFNLTIRCEDGTPASSSGCSEPPPPFPTEYKAGWIREPDHSEWSVEGEDLYTYRNSNIGSTDAPNHSPVNDITEFINSVFIYNGEWRCNFPCAVDALRGVWTRAAALRRNKLTSTCHVAHRPSF